MTATVIAILVEEGILSWKTSLSDVLTGYSILEPYRNVTIELLTSHRSGITDDSAHTDAFLSYLYNISAPLGRVKMAERTLSSVSNSTQGIWAYANMNYILAGLIIDITTGRTVEEIMYTKLFKPLSMHSAGWGATPESSNTSIDNPWGHIMTADGPQAVGEGEENKYRDLPPGISTAGLLHMTIQDWNKFLTVHLDGTKGQASKALNLSTKGFEKLHTASPGPLIEETPGYGYTFGGFARHDDALTPGEYILAHCGSNDSNFACVNIITATKTIFTSFTNIGLPTGELVSNELIGRLRNGTMVF
jgi:D-alanyl-D-alanine carboxypeptidase